MALINLCINQSWNCLWWWRWCARLENWLQMNPIKWKLLCWFLGNYFPRFFFNILAFVLRQNRISSGVDAVCFRKIVDFSSERKENSNFFAASFRWQLSRSTNALQISFVTGAFTSTDSRLSVYVENIKQKQLSHSWKCEKASDEMSRNSVKSSNNSAKQKE